VIVSLAGWFCVGPFHCVRTWWNDDPGFGAVPQDGVVDRLAIIGAVGGEQLDLAVDLVEQRLHLRGVA
jgi:hypothetical protein